MPEQEESERFAGNNAINAAIHGLLGKFAEPSRSRMRRKIRQDRDAALRHGIDETDENARHTFREFLVGERLNDNGFELVYGEKLDGLTPDWNDEQNRLLVEVFTCERGGKGNTNDRFAVRVAEKVTKYRQLSADRGLAIVLAVHGDFLSCFLATDCEDAISEHRLFAEYADLSGIIYFGEDRVLRIRRDDGSVVLRQLYKFTYFGNDAAVRPIDLTDRLKSQVGDAT